MHQDGLVHISEICDRFIKHPLEAVSIGDIVDVQVLSVDLKKQRIQLTMKLGNRQDKKEAAAEQSAARSGKPANKQNFKKKQERRKPVKKGNNFFDNIIIE